MPVKTKQPTKFLILLMLTLGLTNLRLEAQQNDLKAQPINSLAELSGSNEDLDTSVSLSQPLSEKQKELSKPIKLDAAENDVLELSLQKALVISLNSNLGNKIIQQTVRRDKWHFFNTASGLLPDLTFDYNAVNRVGGSSFSSSAGTSINAGTNYLASFAIREVLSPATVFASAASYYDWLTTSKYKDANAQELIRQTANQYYEVMRERGELAVRMQSYKQAQEHVTFNQKLNQRGVGTKFSVIQTEQQLTEYELALLAQQAAARIAEVKLLTILNLPLNTNLRLKENQIDKRSLVNKDEPIEELVDLALKNRPDIDRRKLALKASRQRVNQAIAEYAPALTGSAITTSNTRRISDSLDPNNISEFRTASFGINWPIVDGLGLGQISAVNQKRAEAKQASLELSQERLQIESQIREAFNRSQSTEEQIETADRQLKLAIEGLRLARIRLKSGVGTNIDLIDSQRTYVNAWINKVRATIQYNQSQVDLLRSVGIISIPKVTTDSQL
jgi:outer membrane protein TolC